MNGSSINGEVVAARLAAVRERIASIASRPVRVVAVTKGFGPEAVVAARAAGIEDIGENYAHDLDAKAGAVDAQVRWHFLGPVQRNKVGLIAKRVALWHAVDRVAAGEAIARHTPSAAVLVQVNVTAEPQKSGCAKGEVAGLVSALRSLDLDVRGLMAVGRANDLDATRAGFREVARISDELGLGELSMGMSADLDVALEEGATIVRIGRALLGPRPEAAQARR